MTQLPPELSAWVESQCVFEYYDDGTRKPNSFYNGIVALYAHLCSLGAETFDMDDFRKSFDDMKWIPELVFYNCRDLVKAQHSRCAAQIAVFQEWAKECDDQLEVKDMELQAAQTQIETLESATGVMHQATRIKELETALSGLMNLIESNDFQRNIDNDHDTMMFTQQGMRIVTALKAASQALSKKGESE